MNKIAKGLTILSETTRGGILCDIVFKTAGGVGGKVALVEKCWSTCCMLNFRPSALPPPHL